MGRYLFQLDCRPKYGSRPRIGWDFCSCGFLNALTCLLIEEAKFGRTRKQFEL